MHAQYHGFRKWALKNEGKAFLSPQLEDVGLYYKVICVMTLKDTMKNMTTNSKGKESMILMSL